MSDLVGPGKVSDLIVAQEFRNLELELARTRRALELLWDSLSPVERHHTPRDVCLAVRSVLE